MTSEGTWPPALRRRLAGPGLIGGACPVLIDELSTQLEANPPCELAYARPAFREDHGELRRNLRIFSDDLHATIRDVRNHAIPWQSARRELYLGKTPARTTFALTAIGCCC